MVSEIGWNRPCSLEYIISKNEKSVVFLFLTGLGRGWDLVLAVSFCRLLLYESAAAFSCLFKQQVSREFIELVLVTPTLACSKTCDFTECLVLLKHDMF